MTSWNQYIRPRSVGEALEHLHRHGSEARIVAGGTDLILDLESGNKEKTDALVDVSEIPELGEIRVERDAIVIGAASTHTEISTHSAIRERGTALAESCAVVGGPQVRNVATIGGNVAHALPAADGTTGLLALDAEVLVHRWNNGSVDSSWSPLMSLFRGPGQNTLDSDQLIGAFRFSSAGSRSGSGFERVMRPQGVALPMLGVAVSLTLDPSSEDIREIAIAIGPAGPVPFRATDAEACLRRGPAEEARITSAVHAAQNQATLRSSKHRASREYREEMIAVLLRRVLTKTLTRARGDGPSHG